MCVCVYACVCVQVNAATIDGLTPLYNCCRSGSVSCMELLLQHGARAHSAHPHYPSALHEACKRGIGNLIRVEILNRKLLKRV